MKNAKHEHHLCPNPWLHTKDTGELSEEQLSDSREQSELDELGSLLLLLTPRRLWLTREAEGLQVFWFQVPEDRGP